PGAVRSGADLPRPEGLFLAENEPFDLILLDIMLPGLDGMKLLKEIRKAENAIPVLMLTARDTVADKVSGLDNGADDYLTKPFSFEELLARIRCLLRRNAPACSSLIQIQDLEIDMATHTVKRAGAPIQLSPREYALLEYLALHPNRILTRTELSEHLYDFSFDADSNLIDVCVHRLRGKVDRGFATPLIHTLRGSGYLFKA
ncbi:MAG TPA: response regulator transcription factor, partial [Armatimonadota bacterium]|nr:response regulator transcription factor [Armatimonadota bacterium]